jgi:hypothetical protein
MRLGQHKAYIEARVKAENDAFEKNNKPAKGGNSKKPVPPKYPKMPDVGNFFITFFANLMIVKAVLAKYGYSDYWSNWDFDKLIDSAFLLMIQGYEI